MFDVLSISKSGLKAMQNKIDSTADNIANINTTGYKRKEIQFQELLVNEVNNNQVFLSEDINSAGINMGTKCTVVSVNFDQGVIKDSPGEFHMAVKGKGFFGIRDENGSLMLTRNGGFHINENRTIIDDNGYLLDTEIYLPADEWGEGKISISMKGDMTKYINGENINIGKVILHNPMEPDLLVSLGEGRYMTLPGVEIKNSAEQKEGFGEIVQYSLECSNVDLAKSMTDMIIAQRTYSINGKAILAADDIISMINNIKQ